MIIKYVHASAPDVTKIHDTEKSLKGCTGILGSMGIRQTQERWDQFELDRFKLDKEKGLILSYSVLERT